MMFRFFQKTDKNPKEKKTPKHKETDECAEQSLMGIGRSKWILYLLLKYNLVKMIPAEPEHLKNT